MTSTMCCGTLGTEMLRNLDGLVNLPLQVLTQARVLGRSRCAVRLLDPA